MWLNHEVVIVDPKLTVILWAVVYFYFIERNYHLFLHILVCLEYFYRVLNNFFIHQNICIYTWPWTPLLRSKCPTIAFTLEVAIRKYPNAGIIILSPHLLTRKHTVIMANISRSTMDDNTFKFELIKIFVFAMQSQLLEFLHFFFVMWKVFHILQSKLLSQLYSLFGVWFNI